MKAFFKNIDFGDCLIILGLILIGYGLFLLKNPGILAVTIGVIAFNFGILRSILGKKPMKR
jgi:uncharacterized membrane protein